MVGLVLRWAVTAGAVPAAAGSRSRWPGRGGTGWPPANGSISSGGGACRLASARAEVAVRVDELAAAGGPLDDEGADEGTAALREALAPLRRADLAGRRDETRAKADEAAAAGAEAVGMDDLAEKMLAGDLNYDVVIASPDAMRVVGQLGQVLGPRGLMPNPKVGTVTPNVAEAVKNAKAGQVRYRNDKNGIIHTTIGKVDFDADKLKENLEALLVALKKAKPTQAKGVYIKKISISTTMGAGVAVDQAGLSASAA